jgi:hypothetical protein
LAGCCEYGNEPSSPIKVELLIHLGELELLSKDFCSAEQLLVSSKEVRNKTREEEEREKPQRDNQKDERKKKEIKMENSWNVVTNFNRRNIFYFTSPNLLVRPFNR